METSARKSPLPSFHLVIVAAGSGLRAGGGVPKQFRRLGRDTVLGLALRKFHAGFAPQSVTIVAGAAYIQECRDIAGASASIVIGADDRASSVGNALKTLVHLDDDEILLIHDAARPFVEADDIAALLTVMATAHAATLATPVTDTLRHRDASYVDRADLWALQTPQAFRHGVLKRAHAERRDGIPTDDTSLVTALGIEVKIVPGSRGNFKITTNDDWKMASAMANYGISRTGLGFDVHAFDPARPGPVRLCGIDVPHNRALLGHSDADVGLHALTDALLGAIAAGDIGQHFPPSDPQWKNADSAAFLAHAMQLVGAVGGVVGNLDLTLICEAPKIGPWRNAMQDRVAAICGLAPAQIGIKATTTERLGFTGRREGIAAQAVATVFMAGL